MPEDKNDAPINEISRDAVEVLLEAYGREIQRGKLRDEAMVVAQFIDKADNAERLEVLVKSWATHINYQLDLSIPWRDTAEFLRHLTGDDKDGRDARLTMIELLLKAERRLDVLY